MVWTLFWWFVVLPLMLAVVFTPVFLLLGVIVDYVSRRETREARRLATWDKQPTSTAAPSKR